MTGAERREQSRSIIGVAGLVSGLAWFGLLATPGFMGGGRPYPEALPLVVLSMQAIGLAWMVRIYRTSFDPEPDQHAWRYRAR